MLNLFLPCIHFLLAGLDFWDDGANLWNYSVDNSITVSSAVSCEMSLVSRTGAISREWLNLPRCSWATTVMEVISVGFILILGHRLLLRGESIGGRVLT